MGLVELEKSETAQEQFDILVLGLSTPLYRVSAYRLGRNVQVETFLRATCNNDWTGSDVSL